jgi:hypothetical protein
MIVIYGTRTYGEIEHYQGEYAATRFAHVYWLPLFPVSSTMWVQNHEEDHFQGHRMRWSWKSIAAAYLRTWGLLIGGYFFISPLYALSVSFSLFAYHWASFLFGAALLGSAIYSWKWHWLPKEEEHKRSLFASIVGTHCDPELLPDDMVISLRQNIEKLWEERFPTQTPNDVARYGAKIPAQGALAYSLLRLLAREVEPSKEKDLRDLAETIAKGTHQEKLSQDHPYRTDAMDAFIQEEKES